MKMQAKRTDEKEIPDFLWIIAEESKDAAYIEKELMKEKENLSDVKVHYYEGNEIFISGIQGKEVRKKCDYHMQALYGDGRGKNLNRECFQDLNQKEETENFNNTYLKSTRGKFERIRSACRKLLS
mgnify:CR=1 FL=1